MIVDLQGRVIAITGASGGIGAATAVAAAEAGMDVAIAARRADRLEQVAQRVEATGRRCVAVVCDVNRDDDVGRLIQQTLDQLGRLDVIFANAGYGLSKEIMATTDDQMRQIFETNFYGTLRCIRAAIPAIRQTAKRLCAADPSSVMRRYSGHVLITSSVLSEVSLPRFGAYSATKAAQDSIAGALRAELAEEGVFVTSVHPSTTRTEFFEVVARRSGPVPSLSDAVPKPFTQSPQQVAAAVVRCLKRPRAEVWPMPGTALAMAMCSAMPALTSWLLRHAYRYSKKMAPSTNGQP